MALIQNLGECNEMLATSLLANQPANDRMVIMQDVVDGHVTTAGVRFVNGRWLGEETGVDITDHLSSRAIWFETHLFLPNSACTEDQKDMGVAPIRKPGSRAVLIHPNT
jgi:hypothetical protein